MTPSFNYINVCFKSDSSLSCFGLLFFSSYEMLFSGMTKLSVRTHNACHADLSPPLKELKAAKRYFRWSKIVQSSQSFQSGVGISAVRRGNQCIRRGNQCWAGDAVGSQGAATAVGGTSPRRHAGFHPGGMARNSNGDGDGIICRPPAGVGNGGTPLPASAQAARATCRLAKGAATQRWSFLPKIFRRGPF
jgi:hypothetical protein